MSIDQKQGIYAQIYRCIDKIPYGSVATYGQIAKLVNASGPRQIGYALSSSQPDLNIPWHRVINSKGKLSSRTGSDTPGDSEQQLRLAREGVLVNKHQIIDLKRYQWQPTFEELIDDELFEEDKWLDQPGFG